MQTPIHYFYGSKDSLLSITFYGKEQTCHEAMDPLVYFTRHASFHGL